MSTSRAIVPLSVGFVSISNSTLHFPIFRLGEAKLAFSVVPNCRKFRKTLCGCDVSKIQRRLERALSRRRCIFETSQPQSVFLNLRQFGTTEKASFASPNLKMGKCKVEFEIDTKPTERGTIARLVDTKRISEPVHGYLSHLSGRKKRL